MGTPSFALQIELEKWGIEKAAAAHVLLRAFEQAGSQEFEGEIVMDPVELASAEIEMGEAVVELKVRSKMAAYEKIASESAKASRGSAPHMSKRASLLGKAAMLAAGLLGRVDWEAAEKRAIKKTAAKLAAASSASLKSGVGENLRSMAAALDVDLA